MDKQREVVQFLLYRGELTCHLACELRSSEPVESYIVGFESNAAEPPCSTFLRVTHPNACLSYGSIALR